MQGREVQEKKSTEKRAQGKDTGREKRQGKGSAGEETCAVEKIHFDGAHYRHDIGRTR